MRLALVAIAIVLLLAGCSTARHEDTFSCRWQGASEFAAWATDAQARIADGKLVALHIASTTGTIPDGTGGTCVYDLGARRFQRVVGAAGEARLRMVNARGEGIGYLDYAIEGDALTIRQLDEYACRAGWVELPITMTRDANACRVGHFPAR
jgi:hypothetical protein